ncbi:MAG: hypothetical protein KAR87_04710 [Candidatus Aenigmarchaeota archaeon]|nr:hypothetical protein [Candidatus Aenigmarchaeota archaeon]
MNKICIIIFFYFFFTANVFGFMSNPYDDFNRTQNSLHIEINKNTTENITLHFKHTSDDFSVFKMEDHATISNYTINNSYLEKQGVYEYYFTDNDSNRFPLNNATFKTTLVLGNNTYREIALNYTNADPQRYCNKTNNDFSCEIEDQQGITINAFYYAYFLNRTSLHKEWAWNFSITGISGTSAYQRCDHFWNDFDCSFWATPSNITGAKRQAALINAYWYANNIYPNTTLHELAQNYTNGHAEECDVWNTTPDFDCGNSDDQGHITLAYWNAYKYSGNETYKNISQNLTNILIANYTNQSNYSYYAAFGLFKAYELTGNSIYLDYATNQTLYFAANNCTQNNVCDPTDLSSNNLLMIEAYRQTGNRYYESVALNRSLINSTDSSCNNFNCTEPKEQSWMMRRAWSNYNALRSEEKYFFNPKLEKDKKLKNITISIYYNGILDNPKLYLRHFNTSNFSVFDLEFGKQNFVFKTLFQKDIAKQGIYEYYFTDRNGNNEMRFPRENGTFKAMLTIVNDTRQNNAIQFTNNHPRLPPYIPFFGCTSEDIQGITINAFYYAYFLNRTSPHKEWAWNFSITNASEMGATCKPYYDYDCDNDASGGTGAKRQAALINAYWYANNIYPNTTLHELAQNYTNGHAEECDVWNTTPDFDCENIDDQGHMTLAYWNAYKYSGNETYKNISQNLTNILIANYTNQSNYSYYAAFGLFKAYELTGNSTYLNYAINQTSYFQNNCTQNNVCDPINLSLNNLLMIEAYSQTGNHHYESLALNISGINSTNIICNNFNCIDPGEQSWMMRRAWSNYELSETNRDLLSIEMSTSKTTAYVNEEFQVTCIVTNTDNYENTTIYNLVLEVVLPEGVSGNNLTRTVDNLSAYNTTNITVTVSSATAGNKDISCTVQSDNGGQNQTSRTVTISTMTEIPGGSSSSSSSSSSGGGGSIIPVKEVCKNYTKKYYYRYNDILCISIEKYLNLCNKTTFYYRGKLSGKIFKKCNESIDVFINDSHLDYFLNISTLENSKDTHVFEKDKNITNTIDYAFKYFLSRPIVEFYNIEYENISVDKFYLEVLLQNASASNNYNLYFNISHHTEDISCFLNTPGGTELIDFTETKSTAYVNTLNQTHNISVVCINKTSDRQIRNITITIPYYEEETKEQKNYWLLILIILIAGTGISYKTKKGGILIEKASVGIREISIKSTLDSIKKTVNDKQLKSSWNKYKVLQEQYVKIRKTQDYAKTKKIRQDIKTIGLEIQELLKEKKRLEKK